MLTLLGVSEEKGWIHDTRMSTKGWMQALLPSSPLFSPLLPSSPLFSPLLPSSPLNQFFTLTDIDDPTFGIMVKNVVFGEIAMNQFTFVVPGGGEGGRGGGEGDREDEAERNDTLHHPFHRFHCRSPGTQDNQLHTWIHTVMHTLIQEISTAKHGQARPSTAKHT